MADGRQDAGRGRHAADETEGRPQSQDASSGRGKHASPSPNRRRRSVWNVVFWVALVVFLGALAMLGAIVYSYWQGQNTYDEMADRYFSAPDGILDAEADVSLDDFMVDWEALQAINGDIVGWIYIPDTVVNYPIMHSDDNDYYLNHDFYGNTGWSVTFGSIFLDETNRGDFSDANNVLYGHHMRNGSMFGLIGDMIRQSVFDEHRTVYILTPQGNYRLRTFALVDVASDAAVVQTGFSDADEQQAYIQDLMDRSIVDVDDAPAASDISKTFLLCTCDELPTDGRYLLCAYVAESTVEGEQVVDASGDGVGEDDVAAVDDAVEEVVS